MHVNGVAGCLLVGSVQACLQVEGHIQEVGYYDVDLLGGNAQVVLRIYLYISIYIYLPIYRCQSSTSDINKGGHRISARGVGGRDFSNTKNLID